MRRFHEWADPTAADWWGNHRGALGYLIWTGTEQALVYFYTPSELQAQAAVRGSQRIRLRGVVVEGSLVHKPETLKYEF
ncbi:MAG: cytochrome c maturation protein CcmE, partial [Candidatus Methylomirabilales bacterium]